MGDVKFRPGQVVEDMEEDISARALKESVHQLRKWNILKHLPELLLNQVKYAIVASRNFRKGEYNYAIMVTRDDDVYVIGDNRYGELGLEKSIKLVSVPTKNLELCGQGIIGVSASWYHVAAWTKDGKLFMWGHNSMGELGIGSKKDIGLPQQVNRFLANKKVIKVCCGRAHTICLTESGKIFNWGDNKYYQAGSVIGRTVNSPKRIDVELEECKFVDIACTRDSCVALSACGKIYTWGRNHCGQLGRSASSLLDKKPQEVMFDEDIVISKIACGHEHCLALTTKGNVFAWGRNDCGAVGNGNDENVRIPVKVNVGEGENVVDISANTCTSTSVCLTQDGDIYAWGNIVDTLAPMWMKMKTMSDFFAQYNLGMCETWVSDFDYHQDYCMEVEQDLKSFIKDPKRKTIAFEVERRIIMGCEFYLQRCHEFRTRLAHEWKDELKLSGRIKIDDFKYPVFASFIDFLHTDVLVIDDENLYDALKLSNKYKMKLFRGKIVDLMKENITSLNAMKFYSASVEFREPTLRLAVLNFLTSGMQNKNENAVNDLPLLQMFKDVNEMGIFQSDVKCITFSQSV